MLDAVLIARPLRDDVGRTVDFVVDGVNTSAVAEYLRDDAVVQRSLLTGVWPTLAEHLLADLIAVVETGSPLSLDGFIHRHTTGHGGRETTLDIRASRLDGDLFLVWRDATERTRREAELRVSEGQLVRERWPVQLLQQAILPREMPDIRGVDIAADHLPAQSNMMIHSGWKTFASAAIVLLDTATGRLEWCSAGDLPILVVRSDVAGSLQSKAQIVLGLVTTPGYATHSDSIDVGDRFVMYTDGLVERRSESLDVSLARFLRTARPPGPPWMPTRGCSLRSRSTPPTATTSAS